MLWIIGGIISLFGALSYCELASAFPKSGGEYYLLSKIIHPSIGFVAGLVSATVGFSAPAVLAAIAFANYLKPLLPSIDKSITATFVILILNILHAKGLRIGKIFQEWTTIFKIILILLFIIIAFLSSNHQDISILPMGYDFKLLISPEFAVNLVWVSYAYAGWNSSIYVVGEISQPEKNVFRSIFIGTSTVTVLYVLLNYVFLLLTPMEQLIGKVEVGYLSAANLFGSGLAEVVSLFIGLLLISTVSSYVYIGPRIIQAIGNDYDSLQTFSKIDSNGLPFNAFCLQLFISFVFIYTSTFEQVLLYTGITLIITATITVCSLFYLNYKKPGMKRPYVTWGYPWTSLIFVILNLWVLYYTFKLQTFESFVGLGIIIFSFGLFYIVKKADK
jgi:APA family basic amino acid/polyamine antiporter